MRLMRWVMFQTLIQMQSRLHTQVSQKNVSHCLRQKRNLFCIVWCSIPKKAHVHSVEDAGKAASEIGFPVVLKGDGIEHKTEQGAVSLNLLNTDQVFHAAENMPTNTFLVETMIMGSVAELLVGVVLDPAHGYVLTIAAGGVLTEVLKDSASLMLPCSQDAVERAINKLKIAPIINGYRGKDPADMDAILDCVMRVQACILDQKSTITELEINPLICTNNGVFAVDALIKIGADND